MVQQSEAGRPPGLYKEDPSTSTQTAVNVSFTYSETGGFQNDDFILKNVTCQESDASADLTEAECKLTYNGNEPFQIHVVFVENLKPGVERSLKVYDIVDSSGPVVIDRNFNFCSGKSCGFFIMGKPYQRQCH